MEKKGGIPRIIEILIAFGGLVLLSPILLVAAILVKITSSGPIFFCQKRVGLNGKDFTLYKFRTMRVQKSGPLVTAATDNRITGIGRILRKTKLDELPGLLNVIRGDMSFVGPRPEVPQLVDLTNSMWQETLTVRPGITDPVTIRLRNEEELLASAEDKDEFYRKTLQPYKLDGYVKFVNKKSFKNDLVIIFKTLKAVVAPQTVPPPSLEEIKAGFVEI